MDLADVLILRDRSTSRSLGVLPERGFMAIDYAVTLDRSRIEQKATEVTEADSKREH